MSILLKRKKDRISTPQRVEIERRQFIRLHTVFPVQFQFLSEEDIGKDNRPFTQQGFTKNVSSGGLCLEVNDLRPDWERDLLSDKTLILSLTIEPPFTREPITAFGKLVWIKKVDKERKKYELGICYLDISEHAKHKIFSYARWTKWRPRIIGGCIGVLAVILLGAVVYLGSLYQHGSYISRELTKLKESKEPMVQKIGELDEERRMLLSQINRSEETYGTLQKELTMLEQEIAVLKGAPVRRSHDVSPYGENTSSSLSTELVVRKPEMVERVSDAEYKPFSKAQYTVEVIDSHNVGGRYARVVDFGIRGRKFECTIVNTAPSNAEFEGIDFEVTIYYYDDLHHADVATDPLIVPIPNRVKGAFVIEPSRKRASSLEAIKDIRIEIRQFLP